MISKELFVKVIGLLQEQDSIDEQFSKALDLVCDCVSIVYGTNNKAYKAVMLLLEDACNDVYQYIDLWLYGDWDRVLSDETHEWHLDTVEDLYDFIIEMQPEWTAARKEKEQCNG